MIQGFHRRRAWLAIVVTLMSLAAGATAGSPNLAEGGPPEETAVFAGGCFWGVQAVFQRVKGVTRAVSGYAGGSAGSAQYEAVSRGATGHAESVQVTYDPARISYAELLQLFFTVAHDPTQLDRQGPDVGPSTGRRSSTRPRRRSRARRHTSTNSPRRGRFRERS
jgi:peptide-methionine (S)-S-oxide reductase